MGLYEFLAWGFEETAIIKSAISTSLTGQNRPFHIKGSRKETIPDKENNVQIAEAQDDFGFHLANTSG